MPRRKASDRGFSLIETLVAATTVLVGLSALAQLLMAATLTARRARTLTQAAVFAQQKLETLLPQAALDAALATSPGDTLARNISGYCDFLDASGNNSGNGTTPPSDAVYIRRWAIEPLTGTAVTLVLRVLVLDARRLGVEAQAVGVARQVP
jgi:Tfp pilus assembly protein PilV